MKGHVYSTQCIRVAYVMLHTKRQVVSGSLPISLRFYFIAIFSTDSSTDIIAGRMIRGVRKAISAGARLFISTA